MSVSLERPIVEDSSAKNRPEEHQRAQLERSESREGQTYAYDAIVVLGHAEHEGKFVRNQIENHRATGEESQDEFITRLQGHGLSRNSENRVTAAYLAWKMGLAPKVMLTGGPVWEGADYAEQDAEQENLRAVPHSQVMKEYLLRISRMLDGENAIHPGDILTEDFSIKSTDNIAEAENQINPSGSESSNPTRMVVVSNGFHLGRVEQDLQRFGIKDYLPFSSEMALWMRHHADKDPVESMQQWQAELSKEVFPGRFSRKSLLEVADPELLDQLIDKISDERACILVDAAARQGGSAEKPAEKSIRVNQYIQELLKATSEEVLQHLALAYQVVRSSRLINETVGREHTRDIWGVWGPLMLLRNDRVFIQGQLSNSFHVEAITSWMLQTAQSHGWQDIVSRLEAEGNTKEMVGIFTEKIMNGEINPIELRQYRVFSAPSTETLRSLRQAVTEDPSLLHERVDFGLVIATLRGMEVAGKESRLPEFLQGTYRDEIDTWRKEHEDVLGKFANYETFCRFLLDSESIPNWALVATRQSNGVEQIQ